MGKRFSRSELFEIRNAVSIDRLIAEELDLPVKTSDGRPRFLCPVCNEFQTATNPSTNLARCFRCEKNFNVIDLFILVRGAGFVEAVERLKKFLSGENRSKRAERRDIRDLIHGIGGCVGANRR